MVVGVGVGFVTVGGGVVSTVFAVPSLLLSAAVVFPLVPFVPEESAPFAVPVESVFVPAPCPVPV